MVRLMPSFIIWPRCPLRTEGSPCSSCMGRRREYWRQIPHSRIVMIITWHGSLPSGMIQRTMPRSSNGHATSGKGSSRLLTRAVYVNALEDDLEEGERPVRKCTDPTTIDCAHSKENTIRRTCLIKIQTSSRPRKTIRFSLFDGDDAASARRVFCCDRPRALPPTGRRFPRSAPRRSQPVVAATKPESRRSR